MKKCLAIALPVLAMCTMSAFASGVGVVNMKQVFKASPQVKQIKTQLTKRFAPRKAKLQKMGLTLQADLKTYQKNRSVMSKKKLAALQTKITTGEVKFRQAQGKFQQVVFAAQNKQLAVFMKSVKTAVRNIAVKDKLDVVIPQTDALYARTRLNLTKQVLSSMR